MSWDQTKIIRKISIGTDYKNNAMHYALGQEVYGGHSIVDIVEKEHEYIIFIQKDKEIKEWKSFNKHMGISVEFSIDF